MSSDVSLSGSVPLFIHSQMTETKTKVYFTHGQVRNGEDAFFLVGKSVRCSYLMQLHNNNFLMLPWQQWRHIKSIFT